MMTVAPLRHWFAGLFAAICVTVVGCTKQPANVVEAPLPADEQLRDRLDHVLEFTEKNRHLDTKDQAAWQIVHGALAYGRDYKIYSNGQLVPALEYLLGGGELRGWTMRKADHGVLAVVDAGSKTGQGHPDQWLGYLSQCGLQPEDSIKVEGHEFKIQDMISQAQWDLYDGMEATWTLMAFSTYLPLNAQWTAKDGSTWTIPRMVEMESAEDLGSSSCGGTHRMYGITTAMNRYLAEGGQVDLDGGGPWDKAARKIRDAAKSAHENQQPDGAFSTQYFSRPAGSADIALRISTTGHVLEFLTVALNDRELSEPWVTRAAVHLVECLEKTEKFDLECGALYHAAHGLELYRARRFGPRKASDALPEGPSESIAPSVTEAAATDR
jgi:hypothetical protein